MGSKWKKSTLKKYSRSFLLERGDGPSNEAVYMHATNCPGYCDFACNGNKGWEIAEEINKMEAYDR